MKKAHEYRLVTQGVLVAGTALIGACVDGAEGAVDPGGGEGGGPQATESSSGPGESTSADADSEPGSEDFSGTGDESETVTFVEANGLRFAVLRTDPSASEDEPPLALLLHGFPDTPHTFDALRPQLADAGFVAVAPYMRGYDPSGIPDQDTNFDELGADVLALIEALGYDSAYVVGHDFGATASYSATFQEPGRVRRLVTIAIPQPDFFLPDAGLLKRATHFAELARPDAAELMRADDFAMVDELYQRWSPAWMLSDEALALEVADVKTVFSNDASLNAVLGYYRGILPALPPAPKARRTIDVPAITIAGRTDGVIFPEQFEQTGPGYTAGWELVVADGGHFVHRESPAEVNDAITAFFIAGR